MLENNLDEYTPQIGEQFLSHLANDPLAPGTLRNYNSSVSRFNECLSSKFWVEPYTLIAYELQHDDIRHLYNSMMNDLVCWNFKQESCAYHRRCMMVLDVYMTEYHIEHYDVDVGKQFIDCMRTVTAMTPVGFNDRYVSVISLANSYVEGIMPRIRSTFSYSFYHPDLKIAMEETVIRFSELQYGKKVVNHFQTTIRNLDYYMEQQGIAVYDLDVCAHFLEYYKSRYPSSKKRDIPSVSAMAHFNDTYFQREKIRYHLKNERNNIPDAMSKAVNLYIDDSKDNGNAATTLHGKLLTCSRFINVLAAHNCKALENLTFQVVIDSCSDINEGDWGYVRGFLKCCAKHELTDRDYSCVVPHKRKKVVMPPIYTKEEREKLEMAPDRSSVIGKRDYAIILLIDRLGLRSSDVVNMTFDNLNYSQNYICFEQYKTGNPQKLPLLDDVRQAIDDYIQHGRPESDSKYIFLMAYAPFAPISAIAVHGIFSKYLKAAEVNIKGRKHGGHAFRSSVTSAMINHGMSYEETRFVTGHQSPDMLKHYASLDIKHLRQCALPCAPATGKYKAQLTSEEVVKW